MAQRFITGGPGQKAKPVPSGTTVSLRHLPLLSFPRDLRVPGRMAHPTHRRKSYACPTPFDPDYALSFEMDSRTLNTGLPAEGTRGGGRVLSTMSLTRRL
jgi:hypothetical protein